MKNATDGVQDVEVPRVAVGVILILAIAVHLVLARHRVHAAPSETAAQTEKPKSMAHSA